MAGLVEIVATMVIGWLSLKLTNVCSRAFRNVFSSLLPVPLLRSFSLRGFIERGKKKKNERRRRRRALIVDEIPLFQRANFVSLNKVDSIAAFLPFTARIQFLATTASRSIDRQIRYTIVSSFDRSAIIEAISDWSSTICR